VLEGLVSTLQLVLSVVGGFAAAPEAGALGLALAVVVAILVVSAVTGGVAPSSATRSGPHPRRAIDRSVRPSQSDPDAAGHPRPRAPGLAASAA
jgi:hypothetical protein